MNQSATRSTTLLLGSIILLGVLYLQPEITFWSGIAVHALAVAIPCSLSFMLGGLEINNFKSFLSLLAVFSFGTVMTGIFGSILLSAAVLFVVLSVVTIIGLTYWS